MHQQVQVVHVLIQTRTILYHHVTHLHSIDHIREKVTELDDANDFRVYYHMLKELIYQAWKKYPANRL